MISELITAPPTDLGIVNRMFSLLGEASYSRRSRGHVAHVKHRNSGSDRPVPYTDTLVLKYTHNGIIAGATVFVHCAENITVRHIQEDCTYGESVCKNIDLTTNEPIC